MSSRIFTLPINQNSNYIFALSEGEKLLGTDDWTWLFLRLNPYYRHDYDLYKGAKSEKWISLRKKFNPGRTLISPVPMSLPPFVVVTKNQQLVSVATRPTTLTDDDLACDSRYFCINKVPLSGACDGLLYESISLEKYLEQQAVNISLNEVTLRDFEAPREYGIATWVDPENRELERIEKGSWFYLSQEPIWQANVFAICQPDPIYFKLKSGEKIIIGSNGAVKTMLEIDARDSYGSSLSKIRINKNRPIPTRFDSESSTILDFLICLDDNVAPQLDRVQAIAAELKEIHRTYYKNAIARGTASDFKPIIFNPDFKSTSIDIPTMGTYSQMKRDPNFFQKNWRQVRIDVAAPFVEQMKTVLEQLEDQQLALGDQLAFPIRRRNFRLSEQGDHPLKKALCCVELHLHKNLRSNDILQDGESPQTETRPNSQEMMANAFFLKDSPYYSKIRSADPDRYITKTDSLCNSGHHLSGVREALENGTSLVLSWYHFIANMNLKNSD